jgi:hypothetical protein
METTPHPRDLIKLLKQKRKQLKQVLKGKFSGFTDTEKENYSAMSHDQILGMIDQYTTRIDGLKKGFRSQGKSVSNKTLDHLRSGQSSYRNSNAIAPPSMNPVITSDKTEASDILPALLDGASCFADQGCPCG